MNSRTTKILQLCNSLNAISPSTSTDDLSTKIDFNISLGNDSLNTSKIMAHLGIGDSGDVLILPLEGELFPLDGDTAFSENFNNMSPEPLQQQLSIVAAQENKNQKEAIEFRPRHQASLDDDEDDDESVDPSYKPNGNVLSSDEDEEEEPLVVRIPEKENQNDADEFNGDDPGYEPNGNEDSSEEDDQETPKLKRQRKRKGNKENWDYNRNKDKRMRGMDYNGRGKTEDGKAVYNKPRPARQLLPPCNCKISLKGKTLKCRVFSPEIRQEIFTEFWEKLNWQERKQYVRGVVDVMPPVKKKSNETSRRQSTLVLKLKKDGVSQRVCKKMFLNTLSIGEWSLHSWANTLKEATNNIAEINQQRSNPRSESNKMVCKFFDNLPKMESHYCRARSNKLYLEPIWQSKVDLFNEYRKFSEREDSEIRTVSIKTFSLAFEKLNLSLFIPKKDQCDVCTNFKARNLPEDDYLQHQIRKEDARNEKEKDKAEAKHVYCMDLQKVLLSPHSNVSSLYYKRKLCVHNFTIYT
ncbi:uncharacterized protein LOC115889424 [Sitophilus oryzae]|uniref:Uncharacterized protein LOC115889424 n=1 Tax=Sitophilus oryzae TaxID=7048 RepID=A0A6J2YPK5_SITOR|nr:uncharacterized protein LOC115889424 [Sitophilus oryzae]